ncbi:MAG: CBS domain-containing protein [Anaerolineae bacterium]
MEIILTHEHADFDAVASLLAAYKLNIEAIPVLPSNIRANVREFLTLYQNGLPFVAWDDFNEGAQVERITLTDTTRTLSVRHLRDNLPTLIVDHHPLKRDLRPHEVWAGDDVGAATTLLVERIRERKITITSLEATLLALGIYADTGNFTYGGTNSRDIRAAAWLLEQGANLDTVQRFLNNPLNQEQQQLLEQLMEGIDSRSVQGYDVSVCQARADKVISSINSVVAVLRDILDADALIVLVSMPNHLQLIARSTTDAIHVGQLAKQFGGGGHPRASAAAIHEAQPAPTAETIWRYLHEHVQPAVRIAHLMSFGQVQTVDVDERINDVIARMRRIGHEGYPVLKDGQVVGLLTLRSADRALEHGLKEATVREVMDSGQIHLHSDDAVSLLEEIMVESGWGQIPIVDDAHQLIGIVTRTDLIKHWAQTHPTTTFTEPTLDLQTVEAVLDRQHIQLIVQIAKVAHEQKIYMYMVGGIVRDLLLKRPNFDIDFVIEGDAIAFVTHLQQTFGGRIHPYPPFGTATWRLDDTVASVWGLTLDALPEHLDFATARSELYEHPTALPTVYNSGIKLDLRRRDFTVNTLAVQLSPQRFMWQIIDFYGGLADLDARLIRVLHSLSFIDDPTRILRAVRFSERLHFTIEPRTIELLQTALPMLKRITGERLQNELTSILQEPNVVRILLKLEALGVLRHIHPHWHITPEIQRVFDRFNAGEYPDWGADQLALRWHLLFALVPHQHISTLAQQLLIGSQRMTAIEQTARLIQSPSLFTDPDNAPSVIVAELEQVTVETRLALWLWLDDDRSRQHLEQYHNTWQHLKPTVDGHTLKKRGLSPGPQYRMILSRLRDAWLDGLIYNEQQESELLDGIIAEVYNDEHTG